MTTDDPRRDDLSGLLAAGRRDAADLALYAQALAVTLADALPTPTVRVEHRRGLRGRPRIALLELALDDRRLVLSMPRRGDTPRCELLTEIGGVVIARRQVTLGEWVSELLAALRAHARRDAAAREALERVLGVR
ncbi:hypothetical protein AB0M28_19860 [Streptomyces sp. NPDC051940]|uniref:hypothetical protein n=1 Tax=Streptomyces sp. NPDC051940 TaxID=3155675 RepID=UPI00342E4719